MPRKARQVEVGGRELTISNIDKVFFPESGFTKGEAIGFYTAIADTLLPHLHDRPLTLKRYPDGVTGEHFYEKNAPKHTPAWVKTFAVPRSEGGGDINYVLCNDLATLVWATNLGGYRKTRSPRKGPGTKSSDLNRFRPGPRRARGFDRVRRGCSATKETLRRLES